MFEWLESIYHPTVGLMQDLMWWGTVLSWLSALGFAAYAGFQLAQTIFGG